MISSAVHFSRDFHRPISLLDHRHIVLRKQIVIGLAYQLVLLAASLDLRQHQALAVVGIHPGAEMYLPGAPARRFRHAFGRRRIGGQYRPGWYGPWFSA